MRDMRLSDMSLQAQQYLEEYIPKFLPNHRPVYCGLTSMISRNSGSSAASIMPNGACARGGERETRHEGHDPGGHNQHNKPDDGSGLIIAREIR